MKISKRTLRNEVEKKISIPCCHMTGLHDPQHFENKKYVCATQLANAFINFLKILGIQKVKVESTKNCYWCNKYKKHRKYFFMVNSGKVK